MGTVEVKQLIKTTLTRRGDGKTNETAIRIITQYWNMDGTLEFEIDPITPAIKAESDCKRCNDNGCPACDGSKGSEYNPEPY